jgi:hypothetical protein
VETRVFLFLINACKSTALIVRYEYEIQMAEHPDPSGLVHRGHFVD